MTDADYTVKSKVLLAMLDVLKSLSDSVTVKASGEGALSFILAKLSGVTCGAAAQSFDLNVHDYERSSESSSSGVSKFSASLARPKGMAQAVALLNHFCLVAVSTGVASFLVLSPFLDDVFYEPVRVGELAWPVAFECIISYLSLVENHPSQYTLANVMAKLGGQDSIRAAALSRARGLYSAEFFRGPRGEPRDVNDKDAAKGDIYKGKVTDFSHDSKQGCAAHNYGKPHLAAHVKDGVCKYFHGCNQFVTDKGKAGQCLSRDHVRADCNYDASKKCKVPASA